MSSPSHRGVVGAEPAGSACSAGGSPAPGPSPSASALSFPNRRSRRPDGVVEVVTAVVGAPAAAAARPADAFPARPTRVVCPNLPQRPRSSRSAREETLIFRAFLRGQFRPGAPLWQIWTRPRPGSPQEPHPPHADTPEQPSSCHLMASATRGMRQQHFPPVPRVFSAGVGEGAAEQGRRVRRRSGRGPG